MRWLRDTLFLRFFLLMWAALVVSHFAAFAIVTSGLVGGGRPVQPLSLRGLPTFPSLPPTPGVPDEARLRPMPPPGLDRGAGFGDGFEDGPMLPTRLLVLDYLVRLVVIGAAAALGARWLSAPMRRLVTASGSLGAALGGTNVPRLDESSGAVEVREAARVFNRMAAELDTQFRSRSLLMAALSHDLKTPLTRMRMRLETDAALPTAQRCIGDIREMNELVDTALDVFRHAGADEQTQPVDVQALLQSMADDLAEAGQSVAVIGGAAVARARPVALRRVVGNLLGNAIRYGERAEVMVGVEGERVVVTIDDAGPGIPEGLLESVFQPFFRVESSRNRGSAGTGLGLYIARDLARRQGGEVRLANRPEGGLRATISLPRAA